MRTCKQYPWRDAEDIERAAAEIQREAEETLANVFPMWREDMIGELGAKIYADTVCKLVDAVILRGRLNNTEIQTGRLIYGPRIDGAPAWSIHRLRDVFAARGHTWSDALRELVWAEDAEEEKAAEVADNA